MSLSTSSAIGFFTSPSMAMVQGRGRRLPAFAMMAEAAVRRAPQPFRPGPSGPLGCFGPLPEPLPEAPHGMARWQVPAPTPLAPGDSMIVDVPPTTRPRRGTVILVPPWKLRSRAQLKGYVALANAAGFEVWLTTLPHHLERSYGGRSGQ